MRLVPVQALSIPGLQSRAARKGEQIAARDARVRAEDLLASQLVANIGFSDVQEVDTEAPGLVLGSRAFFPVAS